MSTHRTIGDALSKIDLADVLRLAPRDIRRIEADSRCEYLANVLATEPDEPGYCWDLSVHHAEIKQARLLFRARLWQMFGGLRAKDMAGSVLRRAAVHHGTKLRRISEARFWDERMAADDPIRARLATCEQPIETPFQTQGEAA